LEELLEGEGKEVCGWLLSCTIEAGDAEFVSFGGVGVWSRSPFRQKNITAITMAATPTMPKTRALFIFTVGDQSIMVGKRA
jgi:hypothetical protein